MKEIVLILAAGAMIAACGGESDADHSPAVQAPAAGNNDCRLLEVEMFDRFEDNPYLFFSFDGPRGWVHKPSSSGMPGHGYLVSPDNPRIEIEYLLSPVKLTDNSIKNVIAMRESAMQPLQEISFNGERPLVYANSMGRNATLGVILPHDGHKYDVVINFHGPKDCDPELLKRLQRYVTRSLTPNAVNSFDGGR